MDTNQRVSKRTKHIPVLSTSAVKLLLLEDPLLAREVLCAPLLLLSRGTVLFPPPALVLDLSAALSRVNSIDLGFVAVSALRDLLLANHEAEIHFTSLARVGVVDDNTTAETSTLGALRDELDLVVGGRVELEDGT
jgi:hypothetical protein